MLKLQVPLPIIYPTAFSTTHESSTTPQRHTTTCHTGRESHVKISSADDLSLSWYIFYCCGKTLWPIQLIKKVLNLGFMVGSRRLEEPMTIMLGSMGGGAWQQAWHERGRWKITSWHNNQEAEITKWKWHGLLKPQNPPPRTHFLQ